MSHRSASPLALLLAFGLAALAPAARPPRRPGVTATEIKIGNTNPYSGPASAYGTIGKSIAAYFKKVNDEGGVNGRKINFISYDDGYSPPKTVEMVRKLVEQDQVALAVPDPRHADQHRHPEVPEPAEGAAALRGHRRHQVERPEELPVDDGLAAQLPDRGARSTRPYILKNVPDAKIGILYQNDDYGKDYLKGFEDGLGEAAKKMIVLEQTYEVTDPTIDSQIVNLKNSGANVFFNVTIPKFAVQAIKKAHDIGWKPLHFLNNVSSSLATVLKPAGLDASKGLITALYMKEITDPQWKNDKGFKDWVAFMKKYYPDGALDDQSNAFGYTVAQADDAGAQAVRQRPLAARTS